jgi:hypothetical protein
MPTGRFEARRLHAGRGQKSWREELEKSRAAGQRRATGVHERAEPYAHRQQEQRRL